jgi:hypothetical protein
MIPGRTRRARADQIRDIVTRMNQITTIEEVARPGALPPMLDIRKSSAPSRGGESYASNAVPGSRCSTSVTRPSSTR